MKGKNVKSFGGLQDPRLARMNSAKARFLLHPKRFDLFHLYVLAQLT